MELVTPENLSRELLVEMFESAYMTVSRDDDGDIMLREPYLCFVLPGNQKKWIKLMSLWSASDSARTGDKLRFVNAVNDSLVLVRASVSERGSFCFDHYIFMDGGISKKAIILAVRKFEGLVDAAVKLDEYGVIG